MKKFDLEERTLNFSKDIISYCRNQKLNAVDSIIIKQLIRSATSIGANYREANETDMKKDFRNKIRIARKECRETIYWLELLDSSNNNDNLKKEALELMKILASIHLKTL